MNKVKLAKYLSISIFLFFFMLVIGTTLYYSPSWGLMDDWQNLQAAERVWGQGNSFKNLWSIIKIDLMGWGMFRPVYQAWVISVYHIFREAPVAIYILIAVFNMMVLPLWGLIFHNFFSSNEKDRFINIFIFPLSFFIFTPFWNIFMYISLQEKFLYFFSAFSLYFLKKAYDRGKYIFVFVSILFIVLGILSKATGVYLAIAFCAFSFLDIVFFHYKKLMSFFVFVISSLLTLTYYHFSLTFLGSYTSKYGNNLNLKGMLDNILAVPVVIKLLLIIALFIFTCMFIRIILRKNKFSPIGIIIPLGFLSYILVLSPWGFPTYLLSALTPYVLGLFFPVYLWLNNKWKISKIINIAVLVLLVYITFFSIIVPRISKMADIRKIEEFIIGFNRNNPDSIYFFPPSFEESADAMNNFTEAQIIYFQSGVLTSGIFQAASANYLIFGDECSSIELRGVKVGDEVYHSNTWRIYRLIKKDNYNSKFKVDFSENFAQKVKNYLKK